MYLHTYSHVPTNLADWLICSDTVTIPPLFCPLCCFVSCACPCSKKSPCILCPSHDELRNMYYICTAGQRQFTKKKATMPLQCAHTKFVQTGALPRILQKKFVQAPEHRGRTASDLTRQYDMQPASLKQVYLASFLLLCHVGTLYAVHFPFSFSSDGIFNGKKGRGNAKRGTACQS